MMDSPSAVALFAALGLAGITIAADDTLVPPEQRGSSSTRFSVAVEHHF